MPPEATPHIRVGLAGWSYPDWNGVFYPRSRPKGFSELRYAAERFDALEVNVTFYREVPAALVAGWARTVEDLPGFTFTLKVHQDLTHGDLKHGEPAPPEAAADATRRDLCRRTRESVRPLLDAGRLGCLLLQFPWSFANTPASRDRLLFLREELGDLPLAIELRHRSFFDPAAEGGYAWLERHRLNLANIDLPRSSTSPPPGSINTGPLGYFRLHGRNRRAWFDREAGRDDKYDYLYTRSELEALIPAVERVAARTEATYIIANNHFRGQAPANAFQLLALLGRGPRDVPPALQAEFPFLAALGPAAGGAG